MSDDTRDELRRLLRIALPVAATQVGNMAMGVVDTLLLGRFGTEALAAAAIGNAWIYGWLLFGQGLVLGMDPVVSQAHGARDGARAALALQRGVVLSVLVSLPIAGLWLATGTFLEAFGQEPALAREAHAFTLVQIPSLPFFFAFIALRSYLQAREIVRPALVVMVGANVLNLVLVYALVFGHLGLPRLGVVGAGIATGLCRASMLVGLAALVWRARLHEDAWRPWSRAALAPRGLAEVAGHGWPVAIQLGLETWAFSTAALLAGRLGAVPLAAHTITLNLAALTFMVPLGVAQGAVTRVGNLVGARAFPAAQRAAWVAVGVGAGFMALAGVALLALRRLLPALYTSDPAVIAAAVAILPIAAAFQVFDGTQVVAGGVLRGMGTTRPAAVINLFGFWAVGLPLAAGLGLHAGFGLSGVWWGLAAGLALIASALVVWVALRGPAALPARAAASAAAVDLR